MQIQNDGSRGSKPQNRYKDKNNKSLKDIFTKYIFKYRYNYHT
jgi:hypothetical protein